MMQTPAALADMEASSRGDSTGPTRPAESSERPIAPPTSLRAFPVSAWDRYEILGFLGAGGMGRVFKARDPRLNRFVALKLIRGDEPELIHRFQREAQAQARIDHDNVCKVYEVGEVDGNPYIAMQYIAGRSLKQAKGQITLEQMIGVVCKVADGLHAAHRMGLVHRDIKPANIMLEVRDDSSLHPYVMDFGLAREVQTERLSMNGPVEGTPAYMAPEQAMGEAHQMDRRTDVYSLGATLYEMLCGRPPFVGTTSVDILMSLMTQDPPPIRSLYSAAPIDLESIVMKCLEKDASRRYDSAKALADDLRRYLDGDPVLARRAGLGYRLVKRARKHKAIVALAGAAILCIALLGGAWLRTWISAAALARLSQQLGQDVTEMETFMRLTYSLPLHDTRGERAVIRERMAEIERQMARRTALGEGPGQYATGRGYLALHEFEGAIARLSAAYSSGYAGPEVAQALGQALGGAYRSALEEAQRIDDNDRRSQRIKEAEAKYLGPALRYLKESAVARDEPRAYVEGLIALYEKRYEDARKNARSAFAACPWLYEAKKLEGDAYFAEGREAHEKADYNGAMARYRLAAEALHVGADIARSDADIHDAEADVWLEAMEAEERLGTSPQRSLDEALAALDRSRAASPESSRPYSKKALALFRMGLYQSVIHEDPRPLLDRGLDAANEAVRLDPKDAYAWNSIGSLHITRANYLISIGDDPRGWLDRAAEALDQALRVNPNSNWAWNDLQVVATASAEYELAHGLDPRRAVQRAVDMYSRAIASNPAYAVPHSNIAYALALEAQYALERGGDPRPAVRRALEAGKRATDRWPGFYAAYTNISLVYLIECQYESDVGVDPREAADRAIENAATAMKLNPKGIEAERYAAAAYHVKALYAASRGEDPTEPLDLARRRLDASDDVAKAEPMAARLRAVIELTEARWEIQKWRPAWRPLYLARAALELALKGNPNDADALQTSAELRRVFAERPSLRSGDVLPYVKEGLAAVDRALSINPHMARALATRGGLYLAAARVISSPMARREEANKAASALEQALLENANLTRALQPLLDEARGLASGAPSQR